MFIIAEYGKKNAWRWRGVIIDPATGRITFYRCHRPNRFWSWGVEDEYECALSELRGVYWMGNDLGVLALDIVTPTGRAMLPDTAKGFDDVYDAIRAGLQPTARLRWYQYPSGLMCIVMAIVLAVGLPATYLLARAPEWVVLIMMITIMIIPLTLIILIALAARLRGRPLA